MNSEVNTAMSIFHRKSTVPIPEGFSASDIRTEASTCTGERTIGFFDRSSKQLKYAELVISDSDIADYYKKYGLECPKKK